MGFSVENPFTIMSIRKVPNHKINFLTFVETNIIGVVESEIPTDHDSETQLKENTSVLTDISGLQQTRSFAYHR